MKAVVVSKPAIRPMLSINPLMGSSCILKKRGESAQRGRPRENHVSRHRRHIAGKPSFCFEPGAKRRARKVVTQSWHDAAADVAAGTPAERDHQIRGRVAKNPAKHFHASLPLCAGLRP